MVTLTPRLRPMTLAYLRHELLLRKGHFAFRSGRHTGALLDRDRLLADPEIASRMGYALAKAFFTDKIDTVATPSIWGAGLAQWIAYFLEPRAKVVHQSPQETGRARIAENMHPMIEGQRILLVDNIVVSGDTIGQFADEVSELGGEIIGIGTLWDLADKTIRGRAVIDLLGDIYPALLPEDCPLCAEGKHDVEHVPY
ncbi:MAG TPA: phosphoribosyltransferase family protein [Thermomicrobiales bacterium]|nr:phosphoribosyltransferase family protein [Thermomicrobiales bacterium]